MNYSNSTIDMSGQKKCACCGRAFEFQHVVWDGSDIEYNNQTLWIDSLCSKECAINLVRKNSRDDVSMNIDSILFKNGVPKIYLPSSFDNFRIETPNHARAVDFLKMLTLPFKRFVMLCGDCGTGKTHLAVATMRNIILKTKSTSALFVSAPKLIGEIRRGTLGEIEESEEEVIEKYTRNKLLVIDDIGVEKPSEFVAQCWYRVIDTRISNNFPTIFTSNFSRDETAAKFGPRIASRLFSGTIIPIDGTDKRERVV